MNSQPVSGIRLLNKNMIIKFDFMAIAPAIMRLSGSIYIYIYIYFILFKYEATFYGIQTLLLL
jgi:hypothetical protein